MIWSFHRLVGFPRVAAIEHPFGRPYGDVGDVQTQREVLLAALGVAAGAKEPGHIEHLPFTWHQTPEETRWHPAEPSPLIALIQKRRPKP